MIRETIEFKFENEAQRERFHHRLKGDDFESAAVPNKMDADWRALVEMYERLRNGLKEIELRTAAYADDADWPLVSGVHAVARDALKIA